MEKLLETEAETSMRKVPLVHFQAWGTCSCWVRFQGSQTHSIQQEAQGITWLSTGILVVSLRCLWRTVSESDSLTDDQGAGQGVQVGIGFLAPGCGLGIKNVEGWAGSCIVSVQPALLHTAHCSEGSRAWSLVFCNCYLEIFNNFIFEFMFYKWSQRDRGAWPGACSLGSQAILFFTTSRSQLLSCQHLQQPLAPKPLAGAWEWSRKIWG